MPIYEYKCKNCGYKFDELQKITDKPLRICPQCNKPKLTKLVSNTSFQLKGSGWYVTDFKNKDSKKEKTTTEPETKKKETKTKPQEKSKDTKSK